MSPAPKHTRRWFQFSLGTILWLMLVIALVLFGVGEHRERERIKAESQAELAQLRRQMTEQMDAATREVRALEKTVLQVVKESEERTKAGN